MNVLDAAYVVLTEAGGPLHYGTLTERMLERGLWSTTGKTPADTVSARLSTDISSLGGASRFRRVESGVYALNEASGEAPLRQPTLIAASEDRAAGAGRLAAETRAVNAMSFTDAAEAVLSEGAEPMHYTEITREAIERGLIETRGSTPEHTMRSAIGREIERGRERGERPRFERLARGMIGLVESVPPSLAAEIERHNQDVRDRLLARLREGSPEGFEALVEELLNKLGFDEVERTSLGGDGGIDVRGTFVIGDVVRIRMAVQAKRWQNNVPRPVVQQVRGSIKDDEQGLIITTSDFSKKAREDASGATTRRLVWLMNGKELARLLAQYEIGGVRRGAHDLLSLEEAASEGG